MVATWCKSSPDGEAVGENESVGSPGVGGAHVQRVGRPRADFPGRVQVVKLAAFLDGCCGLGIVVGEAFVDVAIVDDGLWQHCLVACRLTAIVRIVRRQRHTLESLRVHVKVC